MATTAPPVPLVTWQVKLPPHGFRADLVAAGPIVSLRPGSCRLLSPRSSAALFFPQVTPTYRTFTEGLGERFRLRPSIIQAAAQKHVFDSSVRKFSQSFPALRESPSMPGLSRAVSHPKVHPHVPAFLPFPSANSCQFPAGLGAASPPLRSGSTFEYPELTNE